MSAVSTAMNNRPYYGDISQTRDILRRRHSSVTEHVQSILAAIGEPSSFLGAFVSVAEREARQEASAADRLIARLGAAAWQTRPLLGITVAVKDLIQTELLPTRRGSLLENRRARMDAPAVARLREAGAIIVGKTATSEYGWSASTVSRVAPPARNPWSAAHSAGGSSGGSAAAVAAGLCTAALGTDGAGSIRIPAAFCGVVGFKPTFGRIPYVPACADRLAHLGPIARTVRDAAELTRVLSGPHRDDPDSRDGNLPGAVPAGPPRPLRIGWLEFPGTSAEVRRVSDKARSALGGRGHRVECTAVPFPDPYRALVDILAAGEAAGTSPEDEERSDAGRMAIVRYGRTLTGAAVARAEEERLALRIRLGAVMERYDLLAMATVPVEPFAFDAVAPPAAAADGGIPQWLAWSPATYPFNLTGQPALSLPAGLTGSGLPVGVQLVGPCGGDDLVLGTANLLETDLAPLPGCPPITGGN